MMPDTVAGERAMGGSRAFASSPTSRPSTSRIQRAEADGAKTRSNEAAAWIRHPAAACSRREGPHADHPWL